MFGLTRLEAMLLATLALVIAASIGLWRFGYYERKVEHTKDVAKDTAAAQVQEKHDAKADADALQALQQQNVALADWISHHPVQPLIVRRGPSCGTQGGAVAASSQPADVRAGTSAGMQQPDSIDIGPRVRLLATVAERSAGFATACDATVAGRAR